MNDLVTFFLSRLGMASLFLAGTGVLALVLLKILRCNSPVVHRVTWCLVLAQGILVFQLPIQIPWLEATVLKPAGGSQLATSDVSITDPGLPVVENSTNRVAETSVPTLARQHNWANSLFLVWVSGIVFIVGRWISAYLIFLREIKSEPCDREEWCIEWRELLSTSKHRNAPELHVSADVGPILCRLPSGYRIIVPFELWRRLSSEQRKAILLHELTHFARRDVLKTLVANLLALVHWFNPMAWFASRRIEDSIEWTCDDHVRGSEPNITTHYAKALLAIGEYSRQKSAWSTAVFGGRFADRIRRVLLDVRQPVSRTNVGAIFGLLIACLALHVFQVELVAQNPDKPNAVAAEVSDVGTIHKDFFVVPVTTAFQQWYLQGHRSKKEQGDDPNFDAYANINLMSFTDVEVDASRFDFDSLTEALRKVKRQSEKAKIYLKFESGQLTDSKLDAIRVRMRETFGKAGLDFDSIVQTHTFHANPTWTGLSEKEDLTLHEQQLGNEQVIVFPIKTPLGRFLASESSSKQASCYIEIQWAVSLDAKSFLTDSDKAIIRQAIGKMTIPADGVVKLQINLQKPKTYDEIPGLAQVKKDSDYHRDATEFLKSLGFKKVLMSVNCASSVFLSAYE